MHPKDADGMANSVDPDQTASEEAVWSWSALFAEIYLSQYIEFVRYSVYTGYYATSKIEHGLSACTVDNALAKALWLQCSLVFLRT